MLPKDPIMLLSYVNTKLRDEYPSLSSLSSALNADEEDIINKLSAINYTYNKELNKFV